MCLFHVGNFSVSTSCTSDILAALLEFPMELLSIPNFLFWYFWRLFWVPHAPAGSHCFLFVLLLFVLVVYVLLWNRRMSPFFTPFFIQRFLVPKMLQTESRELCSLQN